MRHFATSVDGGGHSVALAGKAGPIRRSANRTKTSTTTASIVDQRSIIDAIAVANTMLTVADTMLTVAKPDKD